MKREPLLNAALIVAIVAAGLQVLVAFGLGLTTDQVQAVTGFVTVVAPLIVVWIARNKVTPVADPHGENGERLVPVDAEETTPLQQD